MARAGPLIGHPAWSWAELSEPAIWLKRGEASSPELTFEVTLRARGAHQPTAHADAAGGRDPHGMRVGARTDLHRYASRHPPWRLLRSSRRSRSRLFGVRVARAIAPWACHGPMPFPSFFLFFLFFMVEMSAAHQFIGSQVPL